MATIREWMQRLWGTLRPNPRDRELEEELRLHLDLAGEELQRRGGTPEEAHRAARLQVGGMTQAMEALRDQRGLPWLDDLAGDVRYGLRTLRRSPVFTGVALLTLSLGIGANAAIFSIVNGVILRPLGYAKPEQLMYLTTRFPASPQFWVSPPEYLEFREINRSFSAVGAYATGESIVNGGDRPLSVRAAFVDDYLLNALGVQAASGRLFGRGETDVSAPPGQLAPPPAIAILSYELWQTAFGGGPIVGQTAEVNGRLVEVLGIMPPGTDLMDNRTEIWLPLGLNPANRQIRGNHSLYLVGRLKDGVTAQSAQTELDGLIRNWAERVGIKPGATGAAGHVFAPLDKNGGHILQMKPLQDEIIGSASRAIWVLQTAVGLVLLIACANLANLLLARAETRRRELAVRMAIGANRGRLLRQFMTEGVLLSMAGGALGLLLARAGVRALILTYPTSLPRTSEVTIDPRVLLFTVGVSMAAGVLFGLAPILHTRVKGLSDALKSGAVRDAAGGVRHHIRRGLITAEVALAVILVTGAALLARTVYNLATVDAGFDRSRLLTFSITLPPINYRQPPVRSQTFQRLLEKLRAVPGVQAATAMTGLPPNRPPNKQTTMIENHTATAPGDFENVDYYQAVMSDYFETMGIPIVQGRGFQPADAASSDMVAVVNEALANTFWKGENPIGKRLRPCCFPGAASASDEVPWFTVIGVAKDVKQGGVDQKAGTEFYQLVEQRASVPPPFGVAPTTLNIMLRSTLPSASLSQTIEGVVREVDRTVPVVRFRDMDGVFAETIRRPRLLAQLLGAFAGLALLLAAVGTYGVFSYMVTERRREIGIRLALGANRSTVLGSVMKQGFVLTVVGVVAGLAGLFGLNRLIVSLLFGVQPTDAPTLGAVVATITLVAAMACWLPAWRASRLDPNVVLRDE